MKEIYLTIDVGTTTIKICALDEAFHILALSGREYQLTAEGDCITLNPGIYLAQAEAGIREVVSKLGTELSNKIRGIAVTTQGETLIPIDGQGEPLFDAVVWLDGRAGNQAEKIRKRVSPGEFYRKTGIPECNGLCPLSKLLWFKEEKPSIYEKTDKFLLLEDYFIYWLTGHIVTEKSLLCTTGYFDLESDELWEEIFELTGLDLKKIPLALDCGEIAGEIKKELAQALKLPREIKIVTGAMDQVCGALGAGNSEPGKITETTGTALCIGKTIKKTPVHSDLNVPVYRHFKKDLQLLLPVCMTAGMALKWFKDNFCKWEEERAREEGKDIYELLSEMAGEAPPLSQGMLMLPYLSGSLQPYHAPEFRGGFYKVSLQCQKADFIRALMEGVGYMLEENLTLLNSIQDEENTKQNTPPIISMGGGAKSAVWCQIKADITGKEIVTCEEKETASIGAAMLCAIGLGRQAMSTKGETLTAAERYIPIPENCRRYKEGYLLYKELLKKMIT